MSRDTLIYPLTHILVIFGDTYQDSSIFVQEVFVVFPTTFQDPESGSWVKPVEILKDLWIDQNGRPLLPFLGNQFNKIDTTRRLVH